MILEKGCSCLWKNYQLCISIFPSCTSGIISTKRVSEFLVKKLAGISFSIKILNMLQWLTRFLDSGFYSNWSHAYCLKEFKVTFWLWNSEVKLLIIFWRKLMTKIILCLWVFWILCLLFWAKIGSSPSMCLTVRLGRVPFCTSVKSFKMTSFGHLSKQSSWWCSIKWRISSWQLLKVFISKKSIKKSSQLFHSKNWKKSSSFLEPTPQANLNWLKLWLALEARKIPIMFFMFHMKMFLPK